MPNFSFLVCLEVVVLWLETKKQNKKQQDNSVELEATLAPAEAEVGAVAKADQKYKHTCKVCGADKNNHCYNVYYDFKCDQSCLIHVLKVGHCVFTLFCLDSIKLLLICLII